MQWQLTAFSLFERPHPTTSVTMDVTTAVTDVSPEAQKLMTACEGGRYDNQQLCEHGK
jgi:hypothetical protein